MDTLNLDWSKTSFPKMEENVITFWREIDAINKIITQTENYKEILYIDGPPFCNGNYHYGHILVSTVKDLLARYFTMNGFKVNRGYGWDTHGLPMEVAAKKIIGYNTKTELLNFGIDKHNDICRSLVDECSIEWHHMFERIGRWIDKRCQYKTMDLSYMETVIWIFNELYNKQMIYEGIKVMPYSTGCNTQLSHFEAKQNYKEVTEQYVTCCFEIISSEHCIFKPLKDYPSYILTWTTTPWTLPSNMAICTSNQMTIAYFFDNQLQCYFLMSLSKYENVYAKQKYSDKPRFKLISSFAGADLMNAKYKPLYDYLSTQITNLVPISERAFRVVTDSYVEKDAGTGFVHLAPVHGEDDFRVCCANGIIDNKNSKRTLICMVDDDGKFTSDVTDYAGIYVKTADPLIIKNLKERNLVFESKSITHSYPFCYRTDTPLIYKITSAWFLNASDNIFRQKMIDNNKKINWMPSNVGTNHFDNWLQGSVDWCISRNRYWGTPIPIWRSDDGTEIQCIGSISELEKLSGITGIKDLHIEYVDKIKIPSKRGKGMLSRVSGVLDCWFESGSVPLAQNHYPFENPGSINLSKSTIADFICESKDQTRGWFYTLTVLATALFDKPAFQNVIVTGIINGNDGLKMAKSKGNYPNPDILINKYGADTLRLYLISSPVVKAESITFNEKSMAKIQQNTIVKMYNAALFLVDKITLYNKENPLDSLRYPTKVEIESMENILDRWIINKTGILLKEISEDMSAYKITFIGSKIFAFIEQLTNWYIKMARERMKGTVSRYNGDNRVTWKQSVQTLLFVISMTIKIMAPITPFISEAIYSMIKSYIDNSKDSIHFESYPTIEEFIQDDTLEKKFDVVQKIISSIRKIRDINKLNICRPIGCADIGCVDIEHWHIIQNITEYIKSEANVMSLKYLDIEPIITCQISADLTELSTYLKEIGKIKCMKQVVKYINELDSIKIKELQINGHITESETGAILTKKHVNIKYSITDIKSNSNFYDGIMVCLDTDYTPAVETEHLMRLITRAIQMHRKKIGVKPWDIVTVNCYCQNLDIRNFIIKMANEFSTHNISNINTRNTLEEIKNENQTSHDILDSVLVIGSDL